MARGLVTNHITSHRKKRPGVHSKTKHSRSKGVTLQEEIPRTRKMKLSDILSLKQMGYTDEIKPKHLDKMKRTPSLLQDFPTKNFMGNPPHCNASSNTRIELEELAKLAQNPEFVKEFKAPNYLKIVENIENDSNGGQKTLTYKIESGGLSGANKFKVTLETPLKEDADFFK